MGWVMADSFYNSCTSKAAWWWLAAYDVPPLLHCYMHWCFVPGVVHIARSAKKRS
jgi:hypothetical protein